MPAFNSKSGLPYPRVNLRTGVLPHEVKEACVAGAGTLLLEFGQLSRMTGNPKYEIAARKALYAIWDQRSPLDLVGNTISIENYPKWIDTTAGIGASTDSFFEV